MAFGIYAAHRRSSYKPNLFRPRSRKPEKMLGEFIAEARRIIAEAEKIRARHGDEIDGANFCPTFDHPDFIYQVFGRMIVDGEPEQFSYDFHELRREFIETDERKGPFNPFDIFLRLSKISGGAPMWHAIWNANSCLSLLYRPPASPKDQPEFEPWFFYDAMISISALAFYVEIAERYGEEMLMAILDGAEITAGYALPTGNAK